MKSQYCCCSERHERRGSRFQVHERKVVGNAFSSRVYRSQETQQLGRICGIAQRVNRAHSLDTDLALLLVYEGQMLLLVV